MLNYLRLTMVLLMVLAAGAMAPAIWAQPPAGKRPPAKPADGEEQPAAAKSAKPAGKPASGEAAKGAAKVGGGERPAAEIDDPAVTAVLATKPSTPAECVRAGKILYELKRPDLAKKFFSSVLNARLDAGQLAALGEEFDSAALGACLHPQNFSPKGSDWRRRCSRHAGAGHGRVAGAGADRRPGGRIQRKQSRAVLGLVALRAAAVSPLVSVLMDPKRAALYPTVRNVLVRLGPDAVGPLVAMLDSPDSNVVSAALRALAALNIGETDRFLVPLCFSEQGNGEVRKAAQTAFRTLGGTVPDRPQGVRLLVDEAQAYFNHQRRLKADDSNRTEMWFWNAETKQPEAKSYSADGAQLVLAARFARQAYALAPEDPQARLMRIATALEPAAYQNGLDKPLVVQKDSPAARASQLATTCWKRCSATRWLTITLPRRRRWYGSSWGFPMPSTSCTVVRSRGRWYWRHAIRTGDCVWRRQRRSCGCNRPASSPDRVSWWMPCGTLPRHAEPNAYSSAAQGPGSRDGSAATLAGRDTGRTPP